MKVIKTTGGSDKTTSEIDLELTGLPSDIKNDIIEETGQLLIEQILLSLSAAKSPVDGESFPKLTTKYKKFKQAGGGSGIQDLELTGDLKDALTFEATSNGLEIGFFGEQADKADGHLKFSGRKNYTPKRRFLPAEGQSFKSKIEKQINEIIDSKIGDVFNKSDFSLVESKSDLYDMLRTGYGGMSRSEMREAVAGNSGLMDILIELDLVRFL